MAVSLKLYARVTGFDETVNVYYDSAWMNYRVRIVGASHDTTYRTDSVDDAMSVAHELAGH